MEILTQFTTLEEQCSYLSDKMQRIHYKYIDECSNKYQNRLVKRGWRRFGQLFLRPNCDGCSECKSIKIDVKNYEFSKSARRVIRKNANTQIVIQKPEVTQEHIKLYNKFHAHQSKKKGWKHRTIEEDHYFNSFVDGANDFGKEVLYFSDKKLIGVDLIDMVDDGISSIYFFYDPDFAYLSLGNFSLYIQINMAMELNLKWIYLGYYVKECDSLNYKDKFKPYLTLQGDPTIKEKAIWKL